MYIFFIFYQVFFNTTKSKFEYELIVVEFS